MPNKPVANRITIVIPFSFKGETLRPSSSIDLDTLMESKGHIPCLYTHIADENDISVYSYEHDVMMMAEMEFEHVEGIAIDFIQDGRFDSDAFEIEWKRLQSQQILQKIALQQLDISDLESHPDLKKALREAYEAGKKEALSERVIHGTADPLF